MFLMDRLKEPQLEKSEYADGIGLASIVFGYPRHIAAKPNTDFKGSRP